jgi:hypothetical protein
MGSFMTLASLQVLGRPLQAMVPRFGTQEGKKWGQFACLVSLNQTPAVNLQNGSGKLWHSTSPGETGRIATP